MILWAAIAVYVLVGLLSIRPVAGHLAWGFARRNHESFPRIRSGKPNGEQWFGAVLVALGFAVVWPLGLFIVRSPIRIGEEKQAELRAREARLREAEKELGL